jgi:hypothetical protein
MQQHFARDALFSKLRAMLLACLPPHYAMFQEMTVANTKIYAGCCRIASNAYANSKATSSKHYAFAAVHSSCAHMALVNSPYVSTS